MTQVFVQQLLNGEWANEYCYVGASGFRHRGYDVIPFTENELRSGELPLSKDTIVHGGQIEVRIALSQIGIRPPDLINYPYCLRRGFLDRIPAVKTLGALSESFSRNEFKPVFIKPSATPKAFGGFVLREFSELLRLQHLPNDEPVYASQPINFLSEYRMFMHKGELVGLKHYRGDPLVLPDTLVLKRLIKRASAMVQVAYAVDVGIAYFPERPEVIQYPTLMIEANDAYGLKTYGLHENKYVEMIEDRWHQMMIISR